MTKSKKSKINDSNPFYDDDLAKLSKKLVLGVTLAVVGNKSFSDEEKIKYLKILFKE